MNPAAQLPETFAAWELLAALLAPTLMIVPKMHWRGPVIEVHHAAGVKPFGLRRFDVQVLEKSCMTPARFQSCNLCGTHIKGEWTPSERSSTAPKLMVSFQQRDG